MERSSAPFWLGLGLLVLSLAFVRLVPRGREGVLPAALQEFPSVLGDWSESILEGWTPPERSQTVSQSLFRTYTNGKDPILSFYVAYWKRQRPGDVAFTAKYASPGRDWSFVREDLARIRASSQWGSDLTVTRMLYERRGEGQLVTYWFIQPGRRAVGSRYWGRVYMLWDYLTRFRSDVALVRVATRANGNPSWDGFEVHQAFLRSALPVLERYFAG